MDVITEDFNQRIIPEFSKKILSAQNKESTASSYEQIGRDLQRVQSAILEAKKSKQEFYQTILGKICFFVQKIFTRQTPLDRAEKVEVALSRLIGEVKASEAKKEAWQPSFNVKDNSKNISSIKQNRSESISLDGWRSIVEEGEKFAREIASQVDHSTKSHIVPSAKNPEIKFLYTPDRHCFVIFENSINQKGKGLTKTAYKAINLTNGNLVCCSTIKDNNPEIIDDFLKEDSVHQSIKALKVSPEIFSTATYKIDGKYQHYVISEMFDDNLASLQSDLLNGHKKISTEDRLNLMKDSAKAVEALHLNRIVHGDLKLANFLFAKLGDPKPGFKVFVIDFDLSYVVGTEIKKNIPTGTDDYLSPQKAQLIEKHKQGEKLTKEELATVYDLKDDVWSLGVMFYMLYFTDFPPWASKSPNAKHQHLAELQPDWFNKALEKIPNSMKNNQEVISMIGRMLSVDPAQRPSMSEVVSFFERESLT